MVFLLVEKSGPWLGESSYSSHHCGNIAVSLQKYEAGEEGL
jgi:hypothetical protein